MSDHKMRSFPFEMPKSGERLYITSPYAWTDARVVIEPGNDGRFNVLVVECGGVKWTTKPIGSWLIWDFLCTKSDTDWRNFNVDYQQFPVAGETIFEILLEEAV